MSKHIYRQYRTISESQVRTLNVMLMECQGFYEYDGEMRPLILKNTGDTATNAYTIENTDEWDPEIHGGLFRQKIVIDIQGLKKLFQGQDRLALNDAKLGVVGIWRMTGSSVSGCVPMSNGIEYSKLSGFGNIEMEFELPFEPGMIGGTLEVRYELFLKEASVSSGNGVASVTGTRLGEICSMLSIYIDGEDSNFPIVSVELKDEPLWWIDVTNLEDPLSDPLSEDYISIVFNKAHKDYERLMQNKAFNTPLFYEVLASAFEEIFRYIYTEYADEMKAQSFEVGTVGFAIDYIKSVYEINVDSSESIHTTVRKMIEKMRNGAVLTQ